jgi:hypothetical protein
LLCGATKKACGLALFSAIGPTLCIPMSQRVPPGLYLFSVYAKFNWQQLVSIWLLYACLARYNICFVCPYQTHLTSFTSKICFCYVYTYQLAADSSLRNHYYKLS